MALHYRHARPDDLPRLFELVATASRVTYDAATLRALPEVWRELLHQGRLEIHVFVDDSRPPAERIRGLGSGVFATEAFTDAIFAAPCLNISTRIVAAEVQGKSVVLTREQAAIANAGDGVNAIGLDFAFADGPGLLQPRMLRWGPLLFDSLRSWMAGWRLRSGVRELVGTDFHLLANAMGWPAIYDHARATGTRAPAARRAYVHGLTRTQHEKNLVRFPASLFFTVGEPRFNFTSAEQELLALALRNVSDGDAAVQLHISPHTVKTRWRSIFEQVSDQGPDWFPRAPEDEAGTRGVEKRRHLLAWLAEHMEEVRPRARKRASAGHEPPRRNGPRADP